MKAQSKQPTTSSRRKQAKEKTYSGKRTHTVNIGPIKGRACLHFLHETLADPLETLTREGGREAVARLGPHLSKGNKVLFRGKRKYPNFYLFLISPFLKFTFLSFIMSTAYHGKVIYIQQHNIL